MRKRGFTLTELLVAMLIIGVIAAITAPMISGLMPNKEKMIVLKYHKVLSDICQELINDKSLYWEEENSGKPCHGFGCTQQPMYAPYNGDSKYKDSSKLTSLIFDKLEGVAEDSNHFTTSDGVNIITNSYSPNSSGDFITYDMVVYVKFRNHEDNIITFASNNKKYNTFVYWIDTNGKVHANDSLSVAYLKNPTKLNDKHTDIKAAKADKKSYSGIPSSKNTYD